MNKLTFIKLGGAVITDKSRQEVLRSRVLSHLISEIARAKKESDLRIILGNGAGSFGHIPAAKYETMKGFVNEDSKLGMAITVDAVARLQRIIIGQCLENGLPAITLPIDSVVVAKSGETESFFLDSMEQYLGKDITPCVYGDVLVDKEKGCTIWSTDKIFVFLARELERKGWEVDQIIHVTEAEGVWMDPKTKEIYPEIVPSMMNQVKKKMVDTKGTDVTGGMWHKIEESLKLTELGIETSIISGIVPDNLYKVLMGDKNIGTTIRK